MSENTLLTATDNVLIITSPIIIDLPLANSASGKIYHITNTIAASTNIVPAPGNNINSYANISINEINSTMSIVSDGILGWHLI